jgi:hypothetical protein
MLNILFEPNDLIEVRCLHKDQIRTTEGRYEPEPHMFYGTYIELRQKAAELNRLNTMGYNIYFGVNARNPQARKTAITARSIVVDIDHKDPDEAEAWLTVLMAEWHIPYPSIIVSSGNGVHYYWRCDSEQSIADWHRYQKGMIATFNLSGKIADPVIHDGPRIMRLPGFVNHKGGAVASVLYQDDIHYKWSDFSHCLENLPKEQAPLPQTNYQGDNANALERALRYHEKREGCGQGSRNAECYKIAACCQNDFGLGESDTFHVICVWNQKNSPPLPESEIREVIAKAKKHSAANPTLSKDRPPMLERNPDYPVRDNPPIDDLTPPPTIARTADGANLEDVAYMLSNYVLIAGTMDCWDLDHGIMMPVQALSLLYPKEIKYWKEDPNRKVILANDLVFEPSGAIKPGQINTFSGFQFAADNRPMPLLTAHLEMLCNDDTAVFEWVMSWCAFQVQNPGTKLATSIIMHGKQGTGKSMFWECFGEIFAPYFGVINQTILESDFNGWASRKTFVLAEEVLATQSKSKLKNVIKEMITGGSIEINQKFSRPWKERCHMNMVFLSNNKLPMLLDEDDRRFCVIKIDSKQDEEYYLKLAAEIADNGPARFYHALKNWDLKGFHAHTKPPVTLAKSELIDLVRDTCKIFLDEWLAEDIDDLPCCECKKQDLYDAYIAYCKCSGLYVNSKRHFYQIVAEEYPGISEVRTKAYRALNPFKNPAQGVGDFLDALNKYIGKRQDRKI